MGVYINKTPTLAAIGRVEGYNENNTTPSAITQQVRVDRLKAAQPQFTGAVQGGEFKNLFAVSNVNLDHPRTKSDFTAAQLCGAPIRAEKLDLIA